MEKEISPTLLAVARQRVARGVRWLDRRAQKDLRFRGWRLQMMHIIGGRVLSCVKMEWNTNDPLSLTLKYESVLRDSDGRVKWATIMPAFGFDTNAGKQKALYLGFYEGWKHSSWYEFTELLAYCDALNAAWQEALGEYMTREAPWIPPLSEEEQYPVVAGLGLLASFKRWRQLNAA